MVKGYPKKLRGNFLVQSSEGTVDNKIFQFKFSISPNEPMENNSEVIFSSVIKLVGKTLHRYSFEDFEGVEFINSVPVEEKIYLSKTDLERFSRGRIKFKDLL